MACLQPEMGGTGSLHCMLTSQQIETAGFVFSCQLFMGHKGIETIYISRRQKYFSVSHSWVPHNWKQCSAHCLTIYLLTLWCRTLFEKL